MSLLTELKRRNVFKVGVAYAVIAWLLIQVAATLLPVYGAPAWIMQAFATLLVLGFPVAVVLAWAFELTPEGIKPTVDVEPAQSVTRQTGHKLNYAIIALLLVAVAVLAYDRFVPSGPVETSIAVLPFANVSADADQDAFTDGFVVELHNKLAQIDDLRVTAMTSSMAYRDMNLNAQQIAAELGVEYLLEGRVTRSDETLRVFASLIRADDGSSVWSNPYDRELNDPLALQLELAEAVAERLSVTFGIGDFEREAGGTTNLDAYDAYLEARGLLQSARYGASVRAFERALSLDPDFGLAQVGAASAGSELMAVAGATLNGDTTGMPERLRNLVDETRVAIARAREMLPDHADLQLIDAANLVNELRWAEAEAMYRRRLADNGASDAVGYRALGRFLLHAGQADRAVPVLERARQLDPLAASPVVHLALAFEILGDPERAIELEREASALPTYTGVVTAFQMWRLAGSGGFDAARDIETGEGGEAAQRVNAALANYEDREAFLAREQIGLFVAELAMAAAALGDDDTAFRALSRVLPRAPGYMPFVWMSMMRDVRRHPDFALLMSEMGLAAYWRETGWPTLCGPAEPEGFECF
jgi:TolB-like protein